MIKKQILILVLPLILGSFKLHSKELKLATGDIVLQPLNCWVCNLIEAQTNSPYSHIGLVMVIKGKTFIAEAWQKVELTPFEEFRARTQKGEKLKILRPTLEVPAQLMIEKFLKEYDGLTYDRDYLWDNFDEKGEKLYCSEMIAKLYNEFFPGITYTSTMTYDVNPDLWRRFFRKDPPNGKPGISPAGFEEFSYFEFVGYL